MSQVNEASDEKEKTGRRENNEKRKPDDDAPYRHYYSHNTSDPPPYINTRTMPNSEYRYVPMNREQIFFTRFPEGDITCRYCGNRCLTTIVRDSFSARTYIWSCLLCWLAGPLCGLIPFFLRDLKQTDHYCPFCHNVIGSSKESDSKSELCLALLLFLSVGFSIMTAWYLLERRKCDPKHNSTAFC